MGTMFPEVENKKRFLTRGGGGAKEDDGNMRCNTLYNTIQNLITGICLLWKICPMDQDKRSFFFFGPRKRRTTAMQTPSVEIHRNPIRWMNVSF